MFLEAQEMMGQGAEFHLLPTVRKDHKMAGFPSSSADVQSWVVQEERSHAPWDPWGALLGSPSKDGLFRAAFGAHVTEPWNRERLYLQSAPKRQ